MTGRPTFDPRPFLDWESRAHYERPADWMKPPGQVQGPLRRPQFKASRSEKLAVLRMLDSSDRLAFYPASAFDSRFTNGLFAIIKNQSKDRMILDARCQNMRESATGRWLRTLANFSSLLTLSLRPDEVLIMGGEDLKDYYYYFAVSDQRAQRNVLSGSLPASEARLFSCFEAAEKGHSRYYAALKTLAMGDLNAVSYGQTSHVAMLLQTGEVSLAELLTLDSRPSRASLMAGICIDDFVVLEKAKRDAPQGEQGRRSAGLLAAMRGQYGRAGLARSPDKAFEKQTKASFWGATVDGLSGDIRANPARALPVIAYVCDIAKLGVATRALLEIAAGSLVSLLSFRRRLLSCLELVYTEGRALPRHQVFKLSDRLRDELWASAILVAAASTNMRARRAEVLYATDASLEWEARRRLEDRAGRGCQTATHPPPVSFGCCGLGRGTLDPNMMRPCSGTTAGPSVDRHVAPSSGSFGLVPSPKAQDVRGAVATNPDTPVDQRNTSPLDPSFGSFGLVPDLEFCSSG